MLHFNDINIFKKNVGSFFKNIIIQQGCIKLIKRGICNVTKNDVVVSLTLKTGVMAAENSVLHHIFYIFK